MISLLQIEMSAFGLNGLHARSHVGSDKGRDNFVKTGMVEMFAKVLLKLVRIENV